MEMTKETFYKMVEESDYDVYEKARKIFGYEHGAHPFICSCCGRIEVADYDAEVAVRMIEHQYCHTCMFWEDIVSNDHLMETHYVAQDDVVYNLIRGDEKSYFRGHGGVVFYFIHEDGTMETCDNVWCRGNVHPQFKEKFKKTCIVTKETYEARQNVCKS